MSWITLVPITYFFKGLAELIFLFATPANHALLPVVSTITMNEICTLSGDRVFYMHEKGWKTALSSNLGPHQA
jgi:hypothetical protein